METRTRELLTLLDTLGSSAECKEAVVPLLCMYMFGLCDSSGLYVQPSLEQCVHVKDTLCPNEWAIARQFQLDVPDCEIFPSEQATCLPDIDGAESESGSGSGRKYVLYSLLNLTFRVL